VRSERVGEKTVVHHYGHGGCGVTLSWGTAELAADEVARTGEKRIAILGCGAVGLATARVLQQRGLTATIYARDLPPKTLSDVAGARWYPFDLFDFKVATPEFIEGVWKASRVAYAVFRKLVGAEYGVFLRPTYMFQNSALSKTSLLQLDSPVHDLLPGLRELSRAENPTKSRVTRSFETMMIEPAIYLPAIMRDHKKAGGTIVEREFKDAAELASLQEKVIVNCTGLGAAALFGDKDLIPIKGQLTLLKPQPEIEYVALPNGLYMFPRQDSIVLGGTFERGVATLEPNREAEERILAGHAKFFASLR
jgi:D-amino-acid oxidase